MLWIGVGVLIMVAPYVMARLPGRPRQRRQSLDVDPAVVFDMVSAGLEAGGSIPTTLSCVGAGMGDRRLGAVAAQLQAGETWDKAWEGAGGAYQLLNEALRSAWEEGVDPEPLLVSASQRIRHSRQSRAKEAAEQLAVTLVLPLGLCQLPAFICLGVVPIVISGITIGL